MIFRPVVGYEDEYEISECGVVRLAQDSRINKAGFVLTSSLGTTGYPQVWLYRSGQGRAGRRSVAVHILVAKAWVDGWFEGAEVNHKDKNRTNSHASNLEWVTRSENMEHAIGRRVMIYSPDQRGYIVTNVAKFCREMGIPSKQLNRVASGARPSWHGWRACII